MSNANIIVESPFPPEEYPRVWYWMQAVKSQVMSDQSPQNIDAYVDSAIERHEQALTWAVYRDDILGGFVMYEPINDSTGNAHCIFKKGANRAESFFGWKTTEPALTQVAADIFAIGVQRIGMCVFQTNGAIQSLIARLGGEAEAVIFNPRTIDGEVITINGEVVPMIQYGLYQANLGKPNKRSATYEDWVRIAIKEGKQCHQHSSQQSPQSSAALAQ